MHYNGRINTFVEQCSGDVLPSTSCMRSCCCGKQANQLRCQCLFIKKIKCFAGRTAKYVDMFRLSRPSLMVALRNPSLLYVAPTLTPERTLLLCLSPTHTHTHTQEPTQTHSNHLSFLTSPTSNTPYPYKYTPQHPSDPLRATTLNTAQPHIPITLRYRLLQTDACVTKFSSNTYIMILYRNMAIVVCQIFGNIILSW